MLSVFVVPGPFGWWIAAYFALAAFASGIVLHGAWGALHSRDVGQLRRACAWSLVAVGLGGLCLVADLESPSDFWMTLTNFNVESWIAWGSRILGLFGILVGVALAFLPATGDPRPARFLPIVLAVTALALGAYPALVLMQATGRPLWDHSLLPLLFVASALHIGWTLGPRLLSGATVKVTSFARLASVILILEVLLFAVFAFSQRALLFPDGAAWIWASIYIVGALLTPILHRVRVPDGRERSPGLALGMGVLIGTFALRVWILDAGQSASSFLT